MYIVIIQKIYNQLICDYLKVVYIYKLFKREYY